MKDPERFLLPLFLQRLKDGEDSVSVLVCDQIASMSDNYAINLYEDIFIPKRWTVM